MNEESYERQKHCGFGKEIWGEEDLDGIRNEDN